jgi:hypothetical protein
MKLWFSWKRTLSIIKQSFLIPKLFSFFFVCVCVCVFLGLEPRSSLMPGNHSLSRLHSWPF